MRGWFPPVNWVVVCTLVTLVLIVNFAGRWLP